MANGRTRIGRNRDISVARRYHLRSSLLTGMPKRNYGVDWEASWRRPKHFGLAEKFLLKPPMDDYFGASALTLLSPPMSGPDDAVLGGAESLSQILYYGYGITGSRMHGDAVYRLRSAPSAGAVYPIEVYVVAGEMDSIPAGIYHFSPEELSLSLLRKGDCRDAVAFSLNESGRERGRFYLVFTSMCGRSAKRFGLPAYRFCLMDCGHVLGNFLTLFEGKACPARIRGEFNDEELAALIGTTESPEAIFAVLQVGREDCDSDCPSCPLAPAAKSLVNTADSATADINSQIESLHTSGFGDDRKNPQVSRIGQTVGGVRSDKDGRALCVGEYLLARLESADIGETLAARRSTRRFADAGIGADELGAVLAATGTPYDSDWLVAPGNPGGIDYFEQLDIFVAVNDVEGLDAGLYRYSDTSGGLIEVVNGNLRETVAEICMGQEFVRQAPAVLLLAADIGGFLNGFGNRGYRYAGIHAGVIGEKIYLTATALGLGASGAAGLRTPMANSLCKLDGLERSVVYAVALGHPAKGSEAAS